MFQSPGKATVATLSLRASRMLSGEIIKGTRVDHNTFRAELVDGSYSIILHSTPIISVTPGGVVTINTGGYNTHTTRDRLNKFLPNGWGVHTRGGVIHVSRYLGNGVHTQAVPFAQRCTIDGDTVTPDVTPAELMSDTKLLNRFMGVVKAKGLPTIDESRGDPWVLAPEQVDAATARDWLESLYWTRRLFILSLQRAGMAEGGIGYTLARLDSSGGKLAKHELSCVRRFLRSKIGRGV